MTSDVMSGVVVDPISMDVPVKFQAKDISGQTVADVAKPGGR